MQNLQAGLAFPSNQDMRWALQSNLIKDCPLTVKDMTTAMKVWGPSIAMLKSKTVRTTPPAVRQDVIEIPREIRECHKDVTLTIDIFFDNKIPFFCYLQSGYLLSVGDASGSYPYHLCSFEGDVQLLPTARFSG